MTDKKCNDKCCCDFSENYDDIGDSYDIERLEDIIKICEFLIQTKKHKIQKRKAFKELFEEDEEEKEDDSTTTITNKKVHPYYVYKYTYPLDHPIYKNHRIPWWDQIWL